MRDSTQFRNWAGKVAAELGMTLNSDPDWHGYGARIHDAAGLGYFLSEPYSFNGPIPDGAKVEISPLYPDTTFGFYRTPRGRIGVSFGRNPAAVAKDITRRLAPQYAETMAAVQAYNADAAVNAANRAALTGRITDTVGEARVSMPAHMQSEGRTEMIVGGRGLLGGDVKFYSDGTEVQFDRFRVPADVAVKMLAVYAAETGKETGRP